MSLSILVYAMSMGAIDLIGCVTKVTEYSSAKTIPARINVIMMTTKPQIRTSISSADSFGFGCGLCWFINLFLQDGGNEVLRALLGKQALGLLAFSVGKVIRVLTFVPVSVFATKQTDQRHQKNVSHCDPKMAACLEPRP
jgi:uncharacterized membrane protein